MPPRASASRAVAPAKPKRPARTAKASGNDLPTAYSTKLGKLWIGKIEEALDRNLRSYRGKIDLIFTSPPFPLNRKKKYGNLTGDDYVKWLARLAPSFTELPETFKRLVKAHAPQPQRRRGRGTS